MILRDLINKATGSKALGDYLKNHKELNYEIQIIEMETHTSIIHRKIDKVIVDHEIKLIRIEVTC